MDAEEESKPTHKTLTLNADIERENQSSLYALAARITGAEGLYVRLLCLLACMLIQLLVQCFCHHGDEVHGLQVCAETGRDWQASAG